jgi:hypothetical protein
LAGAKTPTRQTVLLEKVFLHKLDFLIFLRSLCPVGSSAIVVRRPLSSFPLIVCSLILRAVVVRRCRCLLLLSSTVAVVIVRCCRCCCPPPSLSTAAIFHLRSRHCHSVSPPSLAARSFRPLCSPTPNFVCCCCPLLSLSTFAIHVCHCRLPPPQPSSPLRCLHHLSPTALVLPHCSPLPNHACRCCPPPSSSATVVIRRLRTSTRPPSYKMLIVAF